MISLTAHFDQFVQERTYLVNVTPKTREWYETAWKAFQRFQTAAPPRAADAPVITRTDLQPFVVHLRKVPFVCYLGSQATYRASFARTRSLWYQPTTRSGEAAMNWLDEHKRRVAEFADDVRLAHAHSVRHRAEILASATCGCFYCRSVFPPTAIREWVDVDANGVGVTALCPECGIDSVIGDRSGYEVSAAFLDRMNRYWF